MRVRLSSVCNSCRLTARSPGWDLHMFFCPCVRLVRNWTTQCWAVTNLNRTLNHMFVGCLYFQHGLIFGNSEHEFQLSFWFLFGWQNILFVDHTVFGAPALPGFGFATQTMFFVFLWITNNVRCYFTAADWELLRFNLTARQVKDHRKLNISHREIWLIPSEIE